jgi:hypothetical protein
MRDYLVADLASASVPPEARTVHDIKGATRASVLYVLDEAGSRRRTPPATLLGSALAGASVTPPTRRRSGSLTSRSPAPAAYVASPFLTCGCPKLGSRHATC